MLTDEEIREKKRKTALEYYHKNREKCLERMRNYKNPNQEYQKEYYKKNKNKLLKYNKSPNGIARSNKYNKSTKGIARFKKYSSQNIIKIKEYYKEYYKTNGTSKEKTLYNRKYMGEYRKKEEVKKRNKKNPKFVLTNRLRTRFRGALSYYTKTGKIYKSRTYGIDYQGIIEHLEPFPENLSEYHIDHIIPLCSFNLEDKEEVKKAFAPENHQWLTKEKNLSKGAKIEPQIVFTDDVSKQH